ncbi:ThuA domain-containing protein [Flammeovirga aprica]|uniref:DUF1080 domain-containing protein n=1 Tax=Flammeovirga aprica JL-4 TaxID=694437 RepID=A0A7X9RT58_9BACT|nr:ThuA domain-containing protein [Flammeovirga aprica]NME68085.1 DUF1080 domain-containing protein [Flammeovirga aprica JL-4]
MLTRIKIIIVSLLILLGLHGYAQNEEKEALPSLKGKKVLIVYGGWKGHKPKEYVDKIVPLLEAQGAKITLSDSLGVYTQEKVMKETDLIIQSWTMDKISKEQAKALTTAVKNGTGFAGCHGGMADAFRNDVEYQYMVGGQWVAHPGNKRDYQVNITAKNDPVVKGLKDFSVSTEQYYMHVDPNVKVLATTTFSGEHNSWIKGAVMPVAWKKYYGNGRVFYLSIGHAPEDFDVEPALKILMRGFQWAGGSKYNASKNLVEPIYATSYGEWENLIDKDLSKWDIFMGAPHTKTDIEGYEKFDDVTKGTPIGLNKDPKNVFSVINENDEEVLKITGEIYAGLVTKKEYENYHLKWEFKWGDKKWAPRLNHKRNSGVLYHSIGDYTDFWNVWMTCLECEVQETDCGDFITLGNVRAECPAEKIEKKYHFKPGADPVHLAWAKGFETGRCFKPGNPEKPHGEWNTMEILCIGKKNIHVLNGEVVMVVLNPIANISGEWQSMEKGKIQLQSEAAEVYYKNIKIKSITQFPDKYKNDAGLE